MTIIDLAFNKSVTFLKIVLEFIGLTNTSSTHTSIQALSQQFQILKGWQVTQGILKAVIDVKTNKVLGAILK